MPFLKNIFNEHREKKERKKNRESGMYYQWAFCVFMWSEGLNQWVTALEGGSNDQFESKKKEIDLASSICC